MKAKKKVASSIKPAASKPAPAAKPKTPPAEPKSVVEKAKVKMAAPAAPKPAPAKATAATPAKPTPAKAAPPVAAKPAPVKVAPRKAVSAKAPEAPPAPPAPLQLPSILLEGDAPSAHTVSGPGEKYALGPTPPTPTFATGTAALPESYGTKKLFLTARDPHWLYAHWDFTREQLVKLNKLALDGHLILRVYRAAGDGGLEVEIHVHPESRHWFAHVSRAATKYTAEIGYYAKGRKWTSVATSGATLTPPEAIADDQAVDFATIPVDVPFAVLLDLVKDAVRTHQPLAHALEDLRSQGHANLPPLPSSTKTGAGAKPGARGKWTPAQERALAEIVSLDEVRRVWIGSLEITELIRRQLEQGVSSITAAEFGRPALSPLGGAVTSLSSPFGGEQSAPGGKGFWFNINAELIIYGATERDATVTIGGRTIKLRPDGSFSYRFALPDGRYDLPVVAVSADGTDGRAAELKFTRATEIRGEVGTHPQDPTLKPPTPDNV